MFSSIKHHIRLVVSRFPQIMLPIYRLKLKENPEQPISRDTDILIEGAGGSGNSFTYATFKWSQKKPIRVSGHTHAAAQVIQAIRWGVPTLILIRDPCDSVISLGSRHYEASSQILEKILKRNLQNYLKFYKTIYPYRNKFVIAPFNEVIKNFGSIVQKINDKFKTQFEIFNHDENSMIKFFGDIKIEADSKRAMKKKEVKKILTESKKLQPLIKEAQKVYLMFNDQG